ncbi:MAG: cytochrome c, class I [Gammaproteobacteria bacterium]|nr:cytochrome c, class I [Gammaproteobacteria bacterium]
MKNVLSIILTIAVMGSTSVAVAADIEAGKAKATICGACHGPDGISLNDLWPNLKGQKEGYLVKQIKAFRDGSRVDPTMAPMVNPLTDDDIENLAAYFSSLK